MGEICDCDDDLCVGISANDRWNTLLQLAGLLTQGKAVLEELVGEIESPNDFPDALDRGFLKKRKRSPRNFKKPIKIDHQELENFKKPVGDDQTPETSSGGECDLSPKSTLCRYPVFEIPIKKRAFHIKNPINPEKKKRKRACSEFDGETSSASLEKSKRRRLQLMERHIIIDNNIQSHLLQPPLSEGIGRKIIEMGGRLGSAVCVITKPLYPTDVDSSKCRLSVPIRQVMERFLLPGEAEMLMTSGGIPTKLIQPCLDECDMTFGVWESNATYVLKSKWTDVCINNGLRQGMKVRLWAYRKNLELRFALEALGY